MVISEDPSGSHTRLEFLKWGGEWRLIEVHWDAHSEEDDYTPLANATREARINAMEHLPDLVAKAADAVASEIERVKKADEQARAFLSDLAKEQS